MSILDLNSLGIIPLGIALLAPGSVLLSLEARISSCRRLDHLEKTTRYLAYSLVVYAIFGAIWSTALVQQEKIYLADALTIGKEVAIATVIAFPVPICIGIIRKLDLVGKALQMAKIHASDPIPTAWEKAFGRRSGCLVSISCKDGVERFGLFGPRSLVSDDLHDGDMYFEEAYYSNSDGELVPEPGTQGLWVHRSEVYLIRFHDMKELGTHEQRQQCSRRLSQRAVSGESTEKSVEARRTVEGQHAWVATDEAGAEAKPSDRKSTERSQMNGSANRSIPHV